MIALLLRLNLKLYRKLIEPDSRIFKLRDSDTRKKLIRKSINQIRIFLMIMNSNERGVKIIPLRIKLYVSTLINNSCIDFLKHTFLSTIMLAGNKFHSKFAGRRLGKYEEN